MSNNSIETKPSAVAAPPSEPASKSNNRAKSAKASKKPKTKKRTVRKSEAKRSHKAAAQPELERRNKKAEVMALMKRPKGATLAEIVEATGWQKHTVRGFISILGKKGEAKVESSKNAAGERTYKCGN